MAQKHKHLSLFDCCCSYSDNADKDKPAKKIRTESETVSSVPPSTTNGSRRNPDDVLASAQVQHENGRQDNSASVFIDSPTAPTMIIVNASGVTQSQSTDVSSGNLTTSSDSSQHMTSAEQSVPTDIATVVDQPPVQPRLRFPITVVGMKKRSFNLDWYRLYRWLEYLCERDAAYCYACRLFTTQSGKHCETFPRDGFRDWKHALGKEGILPRHDRSHSHKQAMIAWHP